MIEIRNKVLIEVKFSNFIKYSHWWQALLAVVFTAALCELSSQKIDRLKVDSKKRMEGAWPPRTPDATSLIIFLRIRK